MMPAAQGHAPLISYGLDIARMQTVEEEADQTSTTGFWTKEPRTLQFLKASRRCSLPVTCRAGKYA